jgi:hypothetical protein
MREVAIGYAISLPKAVKVRFAVDAYTVITSAAPSVIPSVNAVESDAPTVMSYATYWLLANVAPATLQAIRNVAEVAARLAITIVDTTACVADGTVYRVVAVVALGLL